MNKPIPSQSIKRIKLLLISGVLPITQSFAIEIDSYIDEIPATASFISKAVYNNSQSNNLYRISIQKIDRPSSRFEKELPLDAGEILYAPQKLMIQRDEQNYFKIFYHGPEDQQERYYRVNFVESPFNLYETPNAQKSSVVFPSIGLSTILIVRPRQLKLAYQLDEKKGTIQNTGNTFFKLIIHQGCEGSEATARQLYMLPGESYQHTSLKQPNRKYILATQRYIPLGQACFAQDGD